MRSLFLLLLACFSLAAWGKGAFRSHRALTGRSRAYAMDW
jgi:hypothetical protein